MKTTDISPKKARQYLIRLQRWRGAVALIASLTTVICSVTAICVSALHYGRSGIPFSKYFQFFTSLANMVTAAASAFIIPFAVLGIQRKRFVYPKWLALMHFAGTVCTTLTFFFSFLCILPVDRTAAVGGANLFLHVICPVMVLTSFLMVESDHLFSRRELFFCLIPFAVYSVLYLVMVVAFGPDRGGWDDLYRLNTSVPIYISFPAMWLVAFLIAFSIRKAFNALSVARQKKLLSCWGKDPDPIEINIEVFGLGRLFGVHSEMNDLTIPYDLLRSLAKAHGLDADVLVKVFLKGLLDAAKEKEGVLFNQGGIK